MGVLGSTHPDPIGRMLGHDFDRFYSPTGINGLAKEDGDRVDILAVDATKPGTGQFRAFIDQCKLEYETIVILEVWNDWLIEVLRRYGFHFCLTVQNGEHVIGWKYDAGQR